MQRLSHVIEEPDRLQRPARFVDLFSTDRVNSDSAQTRTDLGSAGCDGLDVDRNRRFMSQICGLYLVKPQSMGIENALDESRQRELRAEVAAVARGIYLRSTPLLDGARRIAALRFEVAGCEHDEDFMLFAVIDSETDHIPKESARKLCSPTWLEQCDLKIHETWDFYGSQIRTSCERLCARFANEA
jgi:hypothetical protein